MYYLLVLVAANLQPPFRWATCPCATLILSQCFQLLNAFFSLREYITLPVFVLSGCHDSSPFLDEAIHRHLVSSLSPTCTQNGRPMTFTTQSARTLRALGSRYNSGFPRDMRCRCRGTFNVCFILDFSDGTTWLVKVPIEGSYSSRKLVDPERDGWNLWPVMDVRVFLGGILHAPINYRCQNSDRRSSVSFHYARMNFILGRLSYSRCLN